MPREPMFSLKAPSTLYGAYCRLKPNVIYVLGENSYCQLIPGESNIDEIISYFSSSFLPVYEGFRASVLIVDAPMPNERLTEDFELL